MVKLVPIAIFFCLITFGCSSSRLFIEQEYQGKKINEAIIGTILLDQSPRIEYSGNVEPEFGPGDPNTLILQYFNRRVPELLLKKSIFKATVEANTISPEPATAIMRGNEDSPMYGYPVPRAGTQFHFNGQTPDFVLLIDKLSIGTEISEVAPTMGSSSGGGMMMTGGSTKKELKCASDVVIWDNNEKKTVLYGSVRSSASGFFPVITIRTWESVTENYVRDLLSKTPFEKAY